MSEDLKTKIKIDYLKGMKLDEICSKHDVKKNTLKSWIKRYRWSDEKKSVQKKVNRIATKKGALQSDKGCTLNRGKGAPYGNQNAAGHGAPKGNHNARKHGLFSKYLPEELKDIVEEIEESSPVDMLMDQIQVLYANIISAQKKLYVKDIDDMTKELKKQKVSDGMNSSSWEKDYNIQFAWDKQNAALASIARALATFNNMVKTFTELERAGLVSDEQTARISKYNAEISKINAEVAKIKDDEDASDENDGFMEALEGKVDEIWQE